MFHGRSLEQCFMAHNSQIFKLPSFERLCEYFLLRGMAEQTEKNLIYFEMSWINLEIAHKKVSIFANKS